jgi:hypothetical protein
MLTVAANYQFYAIGYATTSRVNGSKCKKMLQRYEQKLQVWVSQIIIKNKVYKFR